MEKKEAEDRAWGSRSHRQHPSSSSALAATTAGPADGVATAGSSSAAAPKATVKDPRSPVHSPELAANEPASITPDLRDAHELPQLDQVPTARRSPSPSTISSGSVRIVPRRTLSQQTRSSREPTGRFKLLKRFWRTYVVISVAQSQQRDHYALERTYLAYIRTSVAFALLGVLIAQLFSLQHSHIHHPQFGFYKVGLPLSCICHGFAIVIALAGSCRFMRQQQAFARGKVHASGWELMMIGGLTTAVVITLFVLVILISAKRGSEPLQIPSWVSPG